jgi:hypothetical protein
MDGCLYVHVHIVIVMHIDIGEGGRNAEAGDREQGRQLVRGWGVKGLGGSLHT